MASVNIYEFAAYLRERERQGLGSAADEAKRLRKSGSLRCSDGHFEWILREVAPASTIEQERSNER